MKTKTIPAIVMLLGLSVAVIITYINGYTLTEMLKVLLIVLFVFLFIGLIIKHLFDKYIPVIEETPETEEDEGSVIEKTSDEGMDDSAENESTRAENV